MVPGEYAEMLRAIGDALDSEQAVRVSIGNDERAVNVSWHSSSGQLERRRYSQGDLAAMTKRARDQRNAPVDREKRRHFLHAAASTAGESRGELLRTLGQNLDKEGLVLEGILEAATGYRVLGSYDGQPVERVYTITELVATSRERRLLRRV